MPEQPTTPDPIEAIERGIEAANCRDYDAAVVFFAPDGVWDMSRLGVGLFEGHDAIRGFFEDWIGAYEDYEIGLTEFRDLGNGVTFSVLLQRGRPTGSSGLVELRYASVGTWANGLTQRSTNYTDIDEARSAAERLAEERG